MISNSNVYKRIYKRETRVSVDRKKSFEPLSKDEYDWQKKKKKKYKSAPRLGKAMGKYKYLHFRNLRNFAVYVKEEKIEGTD